MGVSKQNRVYSRWGRVCVYVNISTTHGQANKRNDPKEIVNKRGVCVCSSDRNRSVYTSAYGREGVSW